MRLLLPLLSLAAFLVLAGCGSDHSDHASPSGADETHVVHASVYDGVQVIAVTVGDRGYEPARVAFTAGIPARMVFTRTVDNACAEQIAAPDFDVEPVDLPLDTPVAIEFTPTETGTYAFACGMDMMRGRIVVSS
jgi:plastocyanin domain-containing protein